MKKDLKIIRKYFSLIAADKKRLLKYILVLIFSNMHNIIIPLIYGFIIGKTTSNLYKMAYLLLIVYFLVYLIGNLIKYYEWKMYSRFFRSIYDKLHEKIINALYKVPIHKLKNEEKGKYINIVTEDINLISYSFENVITQIMDIIFIVGMIIIIFVIDYYIGIIAITVTILNTYLMGRYNNRIENIKKRKQKVLDKRTTFITEIINGLKDIKIFNLNIKLKMKYKKINNRFGSIFVKEIDTRAIKSVLIPMLIFFVETVIIGISIYFISIGRTKIEHLIIIVSYYSILNGKISRLLYLSEDLRSLSIGIDRVKKMLKYASQRNLKFGNNKTDNIKGDIEFKNVFFGYDKEMILKNINIKIPKNKTTAIVGDSGCGKSTIYNLLLRFYKPKKGTIKIDNINILDFDKEIYSHNISSASQDIFVFGDTIKNNLALIDNNFDNMVEACKKAHIHDFIKSLPKGYDTVLSDNASSLSGGQRQRLALARTLLNKSEIILFDEVTSALDPSLKEKITDQIYELRKEHTLVIISHKLEEIINADQIIVIEKGTVVGSGTHAELLSNSYYKNIFKLK